MERESKGKKRLIAQKCNANCADPECDSSQGQAFVRSH